MKILYQGSPGAYSHLAALEVYPDSEIIPCKTFDECFQRAQEDEKLKSIISEEFPGCYISKIIVTIGGFD